MRVNLIIPACPRDAGRPADRQTPRTAIDVITSLGTVRENDRTAVHSQRLVISTTSTAAPKKLPEGRGRQPDRGDDRHGSAYRRTPGPYPAQGLQEIAGVLRQRPYDNLAICINLTRDSPQMLQRHASLSPNTLYPRKEAIPQRLPEADDGPLTSMHLRRSATPSQLRRWRKA